MRGRWIIVTGGAGVLGRAVIAELAREGANTISIDLDPASSVQDAALTLGGLDITDPVTARTAVAKILAETGRLDGLVNVAGAFHWETIIAGGLDTWDKLYRLNVHTAVAMSMAAAPSLIETEGSIVNIGAASANKAGVGLAAYAAAKSGVARLTEGLAEELKGKVRVNAILPSIIDTPANRISMPDEDASLWVAPRELARVIAFLFSTDARPITGACIPVTGRT